MPKDLSLTMKLKTFLLLLLFWARLSWPNAVAGDDDDIDDVVTARCYTGACRVLFNNKGSGVPPYKAPLAPALPTRG